MVNGSNRGWEGGNKDRGWEAKRNRPVKEKKLTLISLSRCQIWLSMSSKIAPLNIMNNIN